MSDHLVFMMGQFEAQFPTDRKYAKNHMWAQAGGQAAWLPEGEGGTQATWRFGFAAYAVRLLQDVYFLDWIVAAGAQVRERQQIGAIESKKAESDLFSPIAGRLTIFNEELLSDPSAINVDKYRQGWLFEIDGLGHELLTPEQYLQHLDCVWEVTQRTIKGQLND